MSAVCAQRGRTLDALHINAVLTGQPGRVTVGVQDKAGPERSSRLTPASLDISLCAAPISAQVGTFQAPATSRRTASYTPEVL